MFDLTSSKLLLLGIIALLVVGPKDLPALLRTIGRYVGMIKRQAAEFRAQFDEAMRDGELAELRKEMESFGQEAESAVRQAESQIQNEVSAIESETRSAMEAGERETAGAPAPLTPTSEPAIEAEAEPSLEPPSGQFAESTAIAASSETAKAEAEPTKITTTERAGA